MHVVYSSQGVCGFLQLYFYTLKRDNPEEWKCQPHRFLTRSNEMHEIAVGTMNMTIAGTVSGLITCWVVNGTCVLNLVTCWVVNGTCVKPGYMLGGQWYVC